LVLCLPTLHCTVLVECIYWHVCAGGEGRGLIGLCSGICKNHPGEPCSARHKTRAVSEHCRNLNPFSQLCTDKPHLGRFNPAQPAPPSLPPGASKTGRNYSESETPLFPTAIGERNSQTILLTCLAEPLRRCELCIQNRYAELTQWDLCINQYSESSTSVVLIQSNGLAF
jgi:hypothetical protein